jgi:hypothetical protein
MKYRLVPSRLICLVLVCCLTAVTSLAYAEGDSSSILSQSVFDEEPTAEGMFADLVFLRTVGVAGIIVGAAVFVATLPFTLPSKTVKKAAKKLVVAPAQFTFTRPLGEL